MELPSELKNAVAERPKVYWEDETRFEENKEPGHATYMPYASEKEMTADAKFTPNLGTTHTVLCSVR